MSFSTSRSSSNSPDESDHESAGDRYYSSQRKEDGGGTSSAATASIRAPNIVASPEQRMSHPLDVSNILNPTPQRSLEGSRRRSAAHFETPRSSSMAHLQNTARSLPPSPIENLDGPEAKRLRSSTISRHLAHPAASRLSNLGGNASQSPFSYTPHRLSTFSEAHAQNPSPGGAHPNIPAPQTPTSTLGASGYPFPSTPAPSGYQQQQGQQQTHQHSQYTPQQQQPISTSVSPTTSYSTYAQPGHTISNHYGNSPYGHSQQTHYNPIMALATAHGSIPVSVDTTAASKSADEKRKRNAGASARFRQRRKEREREMTQRITELEQRIKKTEDERDFYRDLYRDMAMRYPQGSRQPSISHPPPHPPNSHSLPQPHLPNQTPTQVLPLDPPYVQHSHPPPLSFQRIGSDIGGGIGILQREDNGHRGGMIAQRGGSGYGSGYRAESHRQERSNRREGEGYEQDRHH